jgi:hypothetical protein
MSIYSKLANIQQNLKAPKGQLNKFGGYKYRNCEDILQAVKPLLGDLVLNLSDSIEQVGERYYIRATACLTDGNETVTVTAYAREEENKKGMDASQITGSASSYARKYALNGLLAIDDTKDADSQAPVEAPKKATAKACQELLDLIEAKGRDVSKLLAHYKVGAITDLTPQQVKQAKDMLT